MNNYYISTHQGKQEGPYDKEALISRIKDGIYSEETLVWCEGMTGWEPLKKHFDIPDDVIPPPLNMPPPPISAPATSLGAVSSEENISLSEKVKQVKSGVVNAAAKATGLGKLDGFSCKSFFSEMFRKHTLDDVVNLFCSGTSKTTPKLSEVNATWPAPWVFTRMLLFFLILYFCFSLAIAEYENMNLVPGLLFVGSFAVPFCVSIFFYEMNIKRDIPFFEVFKGFMLGGVASLAITLFFGEYTSFVSTEAWWAGFIEEPAKLLATLFIVSPLFRKGNVLHGMLMGCAVGAGFAAFESAGYVYRFLGMFNELHVAGVVADFRVIELAQQIYQSPIRISEAQFMSDPQLYLNLLIEHHDPDRTLIMRALYTPFCHVVWSAITAGAFWHVMALRKLDSAKKQLALDIEAVGDKLTFGLYKYMVSFTQVDREEENKNKLDITIFADYRFLSIFICPVLLHAWWNSEILLSLGICRNLIIGALGWMLALFLVQMGINQVKAEKDAARHLNPENLDSEPVSDIEEKTIA